MITEDVGNQYKKVQDAADAWNVAYVSVPRYEADDCIGAYTKLALKQGHKVYVLGW